ncbi:MAG: hypothetical protein K5989_06860, partial [Lachnospiraceae bacterium]|nr:hypothetical protein [Lachnospiraceae bacterium]
TVPPTLSANILATYCYAYMFKGCEKLKITQDSGSHLFLTLPSGDLPSYAVSNMFSGTGFTGSPVAGGKYYYN